MTLSAIDVVLSPTVTSVYFVTAENWYKVPAKIWAILFRRWPRPLRSHSGCVTYLAKLIAYFFIPNYFMCDYNYYSTVAFSKARLTLWPKNVRRLWIRYLIAAANLGVFLILNELCARCCGVICNGADLAHWCCHLHEFNKWCLLSTVILYVIFQSLWFSIVQTPLHLICLTGKFRNGVDRLDWVAKWVAAWKVLKNHWFGAKGVTLLD